VRLGDARAFLNLLLRTCQTKGQLGGHSAARTYRPSTGMAGSEMVFAITKLVKALSKADKAQFDMRLGTELVSLETDAQNAISGVTIRGGDGVAVEITTGNVVLATGGFANDRAGDDSLLEKYRPDLRRYHTTNGPFATGDGHKVAYKAGAGLIDMDQVQVYVWNSTSIPSQFPVNSDHVVLRSTPASPCTLGRGCPS